MGLLSKLAEWIANAFGGGDGDGARAEDETDETGEPSDSSDETDETDDPDEHTVDRLDPGAATERRTAATDDAVDALRDVRRSQQGSEASRSDPEPPDDRQTEGDRERS